MDQASYDVRETAAFARRVVCRTLTVVGGVAVGTAIAWALSSGTASAESANPQQGHEIPVVSDLVAPVSGTVTEVADRLPHPSPPSADSLTELGDRVKEAADHFGERAADGIGELPECDLAGCELGGLGGSDVPDLSTPGGGRSDFPQPVPNTVPDVEPVAAGLGAVPEFLTEDTATGRAHADGMNRRGSPAPVVPSVPDFPIWPAPFAPTQPSIPAPGNHGHAGNPLDAALVAALPWQDGRTALVSGHSLPATEVTTVGRPGAQPGVTPD